MLDNRIQFDERYNNEEYEETTLYFMTHKDVLGGKYPEAVHAEISLHFPINDIRSDSCYIAAISPTMKIDDSYTDYDWCDLDLSDEEIDDLIILAADDKEMCVII